VTATNGALMQYPVVQPLSFGTGGDGRGGWPRLPIPFQPPVWNNGGVVASFTAATDAFFLRHGR